MKEMDCVKVDGKVYIVTQIVAGAALLAEYNAYNPATYLVQIEKLEPASELDCARVRLKDAEKRYKKWFQRYEAAVAEVDALEVKEEEHDGKGD